MKYAIAAIVSFSSKPLPQIKQKSPAPISIGTRLPSCGTTQVDAKRPLVSRTYHTCRAGNGCGSRQSLLAHAFALPSTVHSVPGPLSRSHRPRLSWRVAHWPTSLPHRFLLIILHYMRATAFCQALIFRAGRFPAPPEKRATKAIPDLSPLARRLPQQIFAADPPLSVCSSPRRRCPE